MSCHNTVPSMSFLPVSPPGVGTSPQPRAPPSRACPLRRPRPLTDSRLLLIMTPVLLPRPHSPPPLPITPTLTGEVTEDMLPYHLQAERLAAGTYYDSGTLTGTVTMSGAGPDQRGQQPIQVTAAAPHSRADHINSSPMLRTTVMNSFPQGYGPPTSPATATSRGFGHTGSPGPMDVFSAAPGDTTVGYVQAASPQPSSFPVTVNRGPLIAAYANGYH
ncbi:hypothetical protein O3P69_009363 [Scylla paramamosain]|uniref:Uncharacterized protein n=1 Tax=Scylla paramamosain TaxID=85552 RepID=A0AAW0TBG1_SCYPA